MTTLYKKQPNGRYLPAAPDEVRDVALATLAKPDRQTISSPTDSAAFLSLKLGALEHEVFGAIFLDNRHRVIEWRQLFNGTIDGTSVYPREVVKAALACNAAAVILAHNHPSGIAEPSQADEQITRRLSSALALIDVRVLDHIIIAGDAHVSLAGRGVV